MRGLLSCYKIIRMPPSPGVSQYFCLSICLPALTSHVLVCHTPSFPFCLKYDLFRKTILTILNMLCVDHTFCERLYLFDFNRESMQSSEVVRTFHRTSLSNRAAYRVRDYRNPMKIQGRTQKYHVPTPPKCQASRVKI